MRFWNINFFTDRDDDYPKCSVTISKQYSYPVTVNISEEGSKFSHPSVSLHMSVRHLVNFTNSLISATELAMKGYMEEVREDDK